MPATTRKGVWDLQQVRDQILNQEWELSEQLWSWGSSATGQLGQNNTTYYSSPIQIPGTTWSSASTGQSSGNRGYSISTKTDGTLWSWGRNQHGQLGQNNTTQYSSPVQIPGTQWSSISCGNQHSLATKSIVK